MKTFLLAVALGLVAAVSVAAVPDQILESDDHEVKVLVVPNSLVYTAESQKKQIDGQIILINKQEKGQFRVMVNGCYLGTGTIILLDSAGQVAGHGQWRIGEVHLYDTLAMKLCSRFLEFMAPPSKPAKTGPTA